MGTRLADLTQQLIATASPEMRYWNIARQRYCCGSARCLQALRLSADRAENAASKPARKAGVLDPEEKVPRETDSPVEGRGFEPSVPPESDDGFETAPFDRCGTSQRPTPSREWTMGSNPLPFVVRTQRKSLGSVQFCGCATAEMGRSTYARADSQVRRRDRMTIQIDSSVTLSPPSGQSQEIFELQICGAKFEIPTI